jgi:hypothetical protein
MKEISLASLSSHDGSPFFISNGETNPNCAYEPPHVV